MLRNFTRTVVTLLLAASAALAYDGPRVTPRPTVNGSFGPIQVHEGSSSVTLAWDLRPWIAQAFNGCRPDRAFFEVKFGSDFVSDTDSVQADRAARVDSGGNLFLHGARTLDIASYGRGAGDYYIRMVAKRGGNGPDDDVARRSASVRVALSAQVVGGGATPPQVFPGTLPTGPISNEPADKVEVLSLTLNPTAPAADEAFTASARIRNRTGRTLQVPWKIVWFGDVPTPRIGDGTATLQPHEELVVQGYRPSPTGISGNSRIVVYLDPERTLGESDEARQNNYKVVYNDFQQPAPVATSGGDAVQAVWISTSSETPGTNQALTVMFVVKNLTNRELRNVEYRILMDGGNEVTFGRIASLAAGEQVEVRGTVPGTWLTVSGPRLFTGIVDPDNRLNESSTSQGNNAVDKSVTVYRTVQR